IDGATTGGTLRGASGRDGKGCAGGGAASLRECAGTGRSTGSCGRADRGGAASCASGERGEWSAGVYVSRGVANGAGGGVTDDELAAALTGATRMSVTVGACTRADAAGSGAHGADCVRLGCAARSAGG